MSLSLRSTFALACLLGCFAPLSQAQNAPLWIPLPNAARNPDIEPAAQRGWRLDLPAMQARLPHLRHGGELALPLSDGTLSTFTLVDSQTMAPELAARYPGLVSLRGHDAQGRRVRLDSSPAGLQAMIFADDGVSVIQPEARGSDRYTSFARRGWRGAQKNFQCDVVRHAGGKSLALEKYSPTPSKVVTGATLRTYRLAVAATGEYTAFHGGTKAGALAGIVATISRVNEIYESDAAVHLTLVANNDLVIYTDGGSDPYSNDDGFAMLDENTATLDAILGDAAYDVGHVFSTGGGGVAGLGVTCDNTWKAEGVTGSPSPQNDPFDIDYVAHELGHQFGANHTFNGTADNCGGGNREASAAYEPGSGSTIMAYAGICGDQDLQPNSDPYFHAKSIEEIAAEVGPDSCDVETTPVNQAPVIEPPGTRQIPARTPFMLTADASDPDGDALTYNWEQYTLGAAQNSTNTTEQAGRPIIRSFNSTPDPARIVPRLATLLGAPAAKGEILPQANHRSSPATAPATTPLIFRVTVRDNHPGAGATASADMTLQITNTGSAFAITEPNTAAAQWVCGTQRQVNWNVAGTTAAPISCAEVELRLSNDGGANFDHVLDTVPNNGSATVTVPFLVGADTRVRAMCADNIFFDLSDADFAVLDGPAVTPVNDDIADSLEDAATRVVTGASLTANDTGGTQLLSVSDAVGGSVALVGNDVEFTPDADFNGTASFDYTLFDACDRGVVQAPAPATVSFDIVAVNDAPSLTLDGDVAVDAVSGDYTQAGFVASQDFGPADESAQAVLDYVVSIESDPNDVVTTIDIAPDGTLQYGLTGNVGEAQIGVRLRDDGGTDNGGVDLSDMVTFSLVTDNPAEPDLRIVKTSPQDFVLVGAQVAYQIVVSNPGDTAITGARVRDVPPNALTARFWQCVGAACAAEAGISHIDEFVDLLPGESITYTLTAHATGAAGSTISNTASVQTPIGISDVNAGDNTSTRVITLIGPEIFADGFETAD
jgi:uncharacterized repeat protein (TIGR01451 family)